MTRASGQPFRRLFNLCCAAAAAALLAQGGCAAENTAGDGGDTAGENHGESESTGPEQCNGRDDDGDTLVDEDFALDTDVYNCGTCGKICSFLNASAFCERGVCKMGECREDYYDLDNNPVDGCEYRCPHDDAAEDPALTCHDNLDNDCDGLIDQIDPDCQACVAEVCNGYDDDCDEEVDEDFDLETDPLNCGECGNECPSYYHAHPVCVLGVCGYECDAGWIDVNKLAGDGCEEECTPSGIAEDFCNAEDDDCDGRVDEDFVGAVCGVGVCAGRYVCVGTNQVCDDNPATGDDSDCDDLDDDCDGVTDDAYVSTTTCGTGGCIREGACVDGIESCTPGTPAASDPPDDTYVDADCDGIDGEKTKAFFVAMTGNDSNPGTMALPKRSIQAGINAANADAVKKQVYVSRGEYLEELTLRSGISVVGGYDVADGWNRAADHTTAVSSPTAVAVRAGSVTGALLGWLTITASDATSAGGASIGILAQDSTGLVVKSCSVRAGRGAAGSGGGDGNRGDGFWNSSSLRGGNGPNGCEYGCSCGCIYSCGSCSRPGNGSAGTSSCAASGGAGGRPGGYGSTGDTGGAGSGGASGGTGGVATLSGARAGNGSDGNSPGFNAAWNGAGGDATGTVWGGTWHPSDGADGARGAHGAGGGGGGGGGGDCCEDCFSGWCKSYGASGGGGGAGGCGGYAGTKGTGGGASIAMLFIATTADVTGGQVSTSGGGNGGRGGTGGDGGNGGPGGSGGSPEASDQGGFGGSGGAGGSGAKGGAGGGGGGGPSIGIAKAAGAAVTQSGNMFGLGAGGAGGASSGGNPGAAGRAENIYTF